MSKITLMDNLQKEKEAIIEMFGIHFEAIQNIPPLGARILGVLILDCCKNGMTFDDLVERMAASKSSISTNLNLLLKLGKINYYTLPGDRKKYFKPSPFSERLNNYLSIIDYEKKIIDRLLAYREATMSCDEERCNLENAKAYRDHVLGMEELTLKAMKRFKKNNQ